MPNVSVIMSVYSEPTEWLSIAIQSILDQTYSDFEFIIVNDNPDNIVNSEILKDFAQKDSRIVLIFNERNIGLTKSLNKALKLASGQYIARMDADDLSLPQRFDRQVNFLNKHKHVLAVGSWTGSIDKEGLRQSEVVKYETDLKWIRAQFIQNSQISHPAVMFRRIINNELVQYDESVRYAQDYSLMAYILQYGEITNIPEVLFCYRHSDIQITTSKRSEQQECAFKAQRKIFKLNGFATTSRFLELFYKLTIKHDMNQSLSEVESEFYSFFSANKVSKQNSRVLELIYGTYLSYLCHINNRSMIKGLGYVVTHSPLSTNVLGLKLFVHLMSRKINRIK